MTRRDVVPVREALLFWCKLGFINFGGPTGQIAIMHSELVDRRRWIDEDRFLHALSFCMLLPGPEAQQLAIYVGWLLNGTLGGIAAGVLFVLPAFFLLLALSWSYVAHGELAWVAAVFGGLSAAVVGIVAAATLTIASRALKTTALRVIAAVVFVATFVVGVPFPVVVLGAGGAGIVLSKRHATWFPAPVPSDGPVDGAAPVRRSLGRSLLVLATGLAAWLAPLALVAAMTGVGSIYAREGIFFSQVAVVTFGGAYAVLAYVGHEVVARFGLTTSDVVAGLGLAETTPGPLILVVEFLGFVAAYRNPGDLSPWVAGTLGAAVTAWATFAPSFLWIFLGAPYVETLRANARLRAGLGAITATVVGVIAGLGLTVAASALFGELRAATPFLASIPVPRLDSLEWEHAAIAVASFVALRRFQVHVAWIVVAAAVAGLAFEAVR